MRRRNLNDPFIWRITTSCWKQRKTTFFAILWSFLWKRTTNEQSGSQKNPRCKYLPVHLLVLVGHRRCGEESWPWWGWSSPHHPPTLSMCSLYISEISKMVYPLTLNYCICVIYVSDLLSWVFPVRLPTSLTFSKFSPTTSFFPQQPEPASNIYSMLQETKNTDPKKKN